MERYETETESMGITRIVFTCFVEFSEGYYYVQEITYYQPSRPYADLSLMAMATTTKQPSIVTASWRPPPRAYLDRCHSQVAADEIVRAWRFVDFGRYRLCLYNGE